LLRIQYHENATNRYSIGGGGGFWN